MGSLFKDDRNSCRFWIWLPSLRRSVEHSNVLELDFAGYWGAQMAVGIRDIFGVSTDEIEYPHFDYETKEDYRQAEDEYYKSSDRIQRYNNQLSLIGSTLGLATGHFIQGMECYK